MKLHLSRHRTPFGFAAALLAGSIAVIYGFVVPTEADQSGGLARFILIHAHSVSWLFVAFAALAYALNGSKRLISILMYSALAVYLTFLVTLLVA